MRKLVIACAAALMLISTGAHAIDFETRITELDGSVPMDDKGQPINLTVGRICTNSLLSAQPGDDAESGEDKIKRSVLAERIFKKEDYKFSAEEIALIKKRVNKGNPSALVVRQVWETLEKK